MFFIPLNEHKRSDICEGITNVERNFIHLCGDKMCLHCCNFLGWCGMLELATVKGRRGGGHILDINFKILSESFLHLKINRITTEKCQY